MFKDLLRVDHTIHKVKAQCATQSLCRYWQGDTRLHAAAVFFVFHSELVLFGNLLQQSLVIVLY